MADAAVFEVKEYMVVLRQLEVMDFEGTTIRLKGIVRCLGEEYTLDVYCLDAESNYPQPVFQTEEKKGFMFVPYTDMHNFVDLLRNEKPIYAHLRGDRPEWTSITTTKEPVGEGEDAMIGASRR
ncbi:MAG: hypothetical protein AAFV33_17315 [Chloroflexota bacterium]